MLEWLASKSIESDIPQSVTVSLPQKTIDAGGQLAGYLGLPTAQAGISECIQTAFRFRQCCPGSGKFQAVIHTESGRETYSTDCRYPSLSEKDYLDLLSRDDRIPLPRGIIDRHVPSVTLFIPMPTARHCAILAVFYTSPFERVLQSFTEEGMLMQSALTSGGKVLLSGGYDTGYSVVSMREQFILMKDRAIAKFSALKRG